MPSRSRAEAGGWSPSDMALVGSPWPATWGSSRSSLPILGSVCPRGGWDLGPRTSCPPLLFGDLGEAELSSSGVEQALTPDWPRTGAAWWGQPAETGPQESGCCLALSPSLCWLLCGKPGAWWMWGVGLGSRSLRCPRGIDPYRLQGLGPAITFLGLRFHLLKWG